MEINLVTILLVIVALLAGYIVSGIVRSKQQNNQNIEQFLKNYFESFEGKFRDLETEFKDVSKEVGQSRVALDSKQDQIIQNQNQIYDSISGSKKVGNSGEKMLENLLII